MVVLSIFRSHFTKLVSAPSTKPDLKQIKDGYLRFLWCTPLAEDFFRADKSWSAQAESELLAIIFQLKHLKLGDSTLLRKPWFCLRYAPLINVPQSLTFLLLYFRKTPILSMRWWTIRTRAPPTWWTWWSVISRTWLFNLSWWLGSRTSSRALLLVQ